MPSLKHSSINFSFLGIGNLILNNNLQVPIYQRPYSWEEKQVLELFDDIKKAVIDNADDVYFIGTIVSTENGDKLDIIDGQQRIATITMLLAAIRDHYFNVPDNDRVDYITNKYLRSKDLKTLELIPKLKLNEADNQYFCDVVLRAPDDPIKKSAKSTSSSNERIEIAYATLKSELSKLLSQIDNDELIEMIDFVHERLSIVHITVADDSNAFTIFETLNDRGLSLAISDLLKNYLFGLSGDRLPEVQANWTTMFGLLESQEDKKIIIEFLRHFFSAKYELVREKDLYQQIKQKIKTKSQAVLFAKELNDNAFRYLSILQSDNEQWKLHSTETKSNIRILNNLGFVQVRPLLLSIVATFSKANIEKGIQFLVSLTVRLLVTGSSGSGSIEESYCRAAQKIYTNKIKTIAELKTELGNIIPSNIIFKNAFKTATISKHHIARYYLLSIENFIRKSDSKELFPSDDESKINLEHILPQKPDSEWNHFTVEDHKAYFRRLGNMTLLSTKKNSDLKSASFVEKSRELANSELNINKYFSTLTEWDIPAIEKRQEQLSEISIKVWKI